MSDEFRDHITPVGGKEPIDGLGTHTPASPPVSPPRSLTGRIVAVHVGRKHADAGGHRLDVTVGGGKSAELVLRVSTPLPPNIEGKRAILYIDD